MFQSALLNTSNELSFGDQSNGARKILQQHFLTRNKARSLSIEKQTFTNMSICS